MLIYGAHLLTNGAALILDALIARGWLTHLATNGAGTIHDWEFSWLGRSTESVRDGVARGCFGTWDETGRNIHIALLAAGIAEEGYGRGLGRFIEEDGVTLPEPESLEESIRELGHPLTAAWAELLAAMRATDSRWTPRGRPPVKRPALGVRVPSRRADDRPSGIGYDIIATH